MTPKKQHRSRSSAGHSLAEIFGKSIDSYARGLNVGSSSRPELKINAARTCLSISGSYGPTVHILREEVDPNVFARQIEDAATSILRGKERLDHESKYLLKISGASAATAAIAAFLPKLPKYLRFFAAAPLGVAILGGYFAKRRFDDADFLKERWNDGTPFESKILFTVHARPDFELDPERISSEVQHKLTLLEEKGTVITEQVVANLLKGKPKTAAKKTKRSKAATPRRKLKEELEALTVVELKDRLREKGLKLTGRKAELVDRLLP